MALSLLYDFLAKETGLINRDKEFLDDIRKVGVKTALLSFMDPELLGPDGNGTIGLLLTPEGISVVAPKDTPSEVLFVTYYGTFTQLIDGKMDIWFAISRNLFKVHGARSLADTVIFAKFVEAFQRNRVAK